MLAPFTFTLFAFASSVLAAKNLKSNFAVVKYDEAYNMNKYTTEDDHFNGFVHYFREKCLQWCGSHNGHHNMVTAPLRVENTASVSCYCCPHSPTNNGLCYTAAQPYSPDDQTGPLQYCTNDVVSLMRSPKVAAIDASVIENEPIATLRTKKSAVAGSEVAFRWHASASQFGGTFYAHFQQGSKFAMLKLTPTQNICTIPAELTGAVEVSIQSSNSMDRLYTVAQGTINIGAMKKRALPRME